LSIEQLCACGRVKLGELEQTLHASQQNVSKHLGILHAAGMVTRTKQGNHTRYAIGDPSVFELCEQVCGGVRRQLQDLQAILQPA
jgi:DNA-binding transcriptional ArsR family regulator